MRETSIRWVSMLAFYLAACPAMAEDVYISHCMDSCPSENVISNDEILVRHLFAASIGAQTGLANWVAYRVLEGTVGVASLLPRDWQVDSLLESQSPFAQASNSAEALVRADLSEEELRSYQTSEVVIDIGDSGRLVPMSSFAGTPYWSDLNYLSNLAPIPASVRAGSWSRLDQAINEATRSLGDLYVVSGPLGTQRSESASPAYFKIVANRESALAFVFNNDLAEHAHYCDQIVELADIEEQIDHQIFPGRGISPAEPLLAALRCNSYQDY